MPLIDLKTNLKSLKFGKDRPGGGSSNQPYTQKDIPEGDSSNIFNTGGPDFLLRGGAIAPIKAANDVSRLTQMFFDFKSPNGPLFTTKQNVLSRTAVKTEASKGMGYGGGAVNAGIYTPLNTLGQAASGFAGTHLNLLGLDPTSPMTGVVEGGLFPGAGLNRYEDVVKENSREENNSYPQTTETTTLVKNLLFSQPILGAQPPSPEPEFIEEVSFKTTGGFKNRLTNIWYNKQLNTDNSPNVLEYNGGPGSVLGVGQTNIKFADQRTGDRNPLLSSNPSFFLGTGHKNKHLNPQSKELKPKLKGVTEFASKLLPSENDREEIKNDENPNRITETYNVLDRSNEESSNAINKTTGTLDGAQTPTTQKITYNNAIGVRGVSNLYNNLVKPIGGSELDNDFITGREFFNVYDPNITPGNTWPKNTPLQSSNGSLTYNQNQLIAASPVSKGGKLQDFREPLLDGKESSTIMSLSPSYNPAENKTIEGRVNLGNPGDKTRNRIRYSTSAEILDKINASEIYEADLPDHSSESKLNDLAKFSIGIVNNSNSSTSNYINFRAFLDSFDDQFSADWGSTQYVGRADKFHNYKGFDRTINMSWTVFAQSKAELIPMYKKLNYLASSLSPRYSSGGFMQGNLARLTVGGYLYNQLGIIKGINYSIPEESPWEIGINEEGGFDSTVKELPHMIKVTGFQFIPIQDFVPQKALFRSHKVQTSRYISLANGNGNSNYDS